MVGDGINDAAALARADVSFAIGAGHDITNEASDVIIPGGNPAAIDDVFDLAALSVRATRQNLCFAFLYNLTAIPVAAAGLLNPLIAVTAMFMSSLTVIGNALRLSRK
jgi:P-type Cu+ transporter